MRRIAQRRHLRALDPATMNIPALVTQQDDPARALASESSNQAAPTATTTPDEPPLQNDDEERLQCTHEGCDRSFKKAAHLKRHMKSRASRSSPRRLFKFRGEPTSTDCRHARPADDSAPSFECASCGKKFMRRCAAVRACSLVVPSSL